MRGVFTILLISTILLNCSKTGSSSAGANHEPPLAETQKKRVYMESGTWDPKRASLICPVGMACPAALGALIFEMPLNRDGKIPLDLCTSFLIDHQKIMTSGHCAPNADVKAGYFLTHDATTGKDLLRHVRSTIFLQSPTAIETPDAAVMELDQAIEEIEPLRLAHGDAVEFPQAKTFVINYDLSKKLTATIGELNCKVRPNEALFPYGLKDKPNVFRAFDCIGIKGNSGSPVFSAGDLTLVEGVLQGFGTPDRKASNFANHDFAIATNLRCLNYPEPSRLKCFQPSSKDISKHFGDLQNQMANSLLSRVASWGEQSGFGYKNFFFQKVDEMGTPSLDYVLFYFPVCHSPGWDQKALSVPEESLQMVFDNWGDPSWVTVSTEVAPGSVTGSFPGNVYSLKMTWPPSHGPYVEGDKDTAQQSGPSFSIALPECSR